MRSLVVYWCIEDLLRSSVVRLTYGLAMYNRLFVINREPTRFLPAQLPRETKKAAVDLECSERANGHECHEVELFEQ